jgi:hypothetical protein
MSRPLGVTVAVVTVLMISLFASASPLVAVTVFSVATIARMEGDNFLGGCRLGHDGGRATTHVRNKWWRLSRPGQLDDERGLGRVKRRRPGHVAVSG